MSRLDRLISGISWGGASIAVMAAFQLVFMAILSRLLEPAEFGLIALANVSLRFLSYFSQMGITPALVQKPTLSKADISASFQVSIAIGLFFACLMFLLAPLAEAFFSMPKLKPVIQVMACTFVIAAFSSVNNGLLRRDMRFREVAVIDTSSYLIGYGAVGISLAYSGFGVWSLVGAVISQALAGAMVGYVITQFNPVHPVLAEDRRHFLRFGSRYSLIGFLEFLGANIDAMVIGKLWGESAAGIYNRALLLANLPVQQPANVLSAALFPVLSSLGDQRSKEAMGFQLGVLFVGGYALAVSAGIVAAAPEIVGVLLGEKWVATIPVLQILSLSVAPIFISHICGVSLDAAAALNLKLKIQAGSLLLLAAVMSLLYPCGLEGLALSVVISETVKLVAYCAAMTRRYSLSLRIWVRILLVMVVWAVSAAGLILLVRQTTLPLLSIYLVLVLEILAGVGGLVLGTFLTRRFLAAMTPVQFIVQHKPWLSRFLNMDKH